MKKFINTMANGFWHIAMSISATVFFALGVYLFDGFINASGFMAVGFFFSIILCFIFGIAITYLIGCNVRTINKK